MTEYPAYGYAKKKLSILTGCTLGCDYCWAKGMAYRQKGRNGYPLDNPMRPTFHADKLNLPDRWRKPQIVACNFMGEWGDPAWDNDRHVFADFMTVVSNNPQHTFLTLTKQPTNIFNYLNWLMDYSEELFDESLSYNNFPDNLWLGYSPTRQKDLDDNMADFLGLPGKKWLSIEPMTGPIDLSGWGICGECGGDGFRQGTERHDGVYEVVEAPCPNGCNGEHEGAISQVILGGMTGPKATPMHPDWVRRVRDDCEAAGVPFFFKQWGEWAGYDVYRNIDKITSWEIHYVNLSGEIKRVSDSLVDLKCTPVARVGKKAAGRLLDGREHNDLAWSK